MSEFLIITGLSGRAQHGGRHVRGPRLVRHRQPAAGADRQGRRAGRTSRRRSETEQVALVVGRSGPATSTSSPPPSTPLRDEGQRACASCSSTPPTTCSSAATRTPAAATRSPARAASPRASSASAPCSTRSRPRPTSSSTPATSTSTSSATASLDLFARDDRSRRMQTSVVSLRVQARPPARRRPRLRLPLPPEPPLGRRAAPPDRPRRAGAATTSSASPRPASSSSSSTTCSTSSCRPTCKEGKSLPDVAVGCTGGRHRSVVIAEELAPRPRRARLRPRCVMHRDIDR